MTYTMTREGYTITVTGYDRMDGKDYALGFVIGRDEWADWSKRMQALDFSFAKTKEALADG